MRRHGRRAYAALLATTAACCVALPAQAQAQFGSWDAADGVVQAREGDQEPPVTSDDGETVGDLLAHAYGFERTSSPVAYVRLRYFSELSPAREALTALDFDRDGVPEVGVRTSVRITNTSGGDSQPYDVYDLRGSGTTAACLVLPTDPAKRLFGGSTTADGSNPARIAADVTQLTATVGAGLMRYAPRLVTVLVDDADAAGGTQRDAIPSAAGGTGRCGAGNAGWPIRFADATDRIEPGDSVNGTTAEEDPADNPSGNADLRRVAVEQREHLAFAGDAVTPSSTNLDVALYPADLTLDFQSTAAMSTVTYLWPHGSRKSPMAMVVTDRVAGDPAKVRVRIARKLRQWDLAPAFGARACLPVATSTTLGGTPLVDPEDVITVDLPLTAGVDGARRVTIALDGALGEVQGTSRSGPALWQLRFHTISSPGEIFPPADVDHVPYLAGYGPNDGLIASGCQAPGSGAGAFANPQNGAYVYPDRTSYAGPNPAVAQLTATPSEATRAQDVTFSTAGTSGGTLRCFLGGSTFLLDTCPTGAGLTKRFDTSLRAWLTVDTPDGLWASDHADVTIVNAAPTADIEFDGTPPAQGSDGTFAVVGGQPVEVPLKATASDADPGAVLSYSWSVTPSLPGLGGTQTSKLVPVFTAPGTWTVKVEVSDGTDTTTATRTIEVVRAPAGDVSIKPVAKVVAGNPFDLEGLVAGSGHQALTWEWDVDGNATEEWVSGAQLRTGVTIAQPNAAYPVRVRATDAGGRRATATLALNVRRANEQPPLAALAVTEPGGGATSGVPVTFDASASRYVDVDGTPQGQVGVSPSDVRFHWDFGDGTPPLETASARVDHTFAGSGAYDVRVVVEDRRAAPSSSSDPAVRTVRVGPGTSDANAPAAVIARQEPAPDKPVFAGRAVTLSAFGSAAKPGHGPLSYAWDLDGDGTFEHPAGEQLQVTFRPDAPGPLDVRVKVTDTFRSTAVSAVLRLDVNPEPTKAPIATLTGPKELTLNGVSVSGTLDATGSTGQNLDPAVRFEWDLDRDGTFETPTGGEPRVTATFKAPGDKVMRVRVTDTYGNQAIAEHTVRVRSFLDALAGCDGATAFREVGYGPVKLRGCIATIQRPNAGPLYIGKGRLSLGGLIITGARGSTAVRREFPDCTSADCAAAVAQYNDPRQAWALALDPAQGTLQSNAPAAITAEGTGINLPLSLDVLDVTLPYKPEEGNGFTIRTPTGSALFDFPLKGSATVTFPAEGETVVKLDVGLPSVLDGITGKAQIRATPTQGVVLDELRVDVGQVFLSKKLGLGELYFVYNRQQELWGGGATMRIPSPTRLDVRAEVEVQHNRFKRIFAGVEGINRPIAKFIFLQGIRAGVAVDPVDLTGGITLSAGPRIKGMYIVGLYGDFRVKFPSPDANYTLFQLTGRTRLLDFPIADSFIQFSSNGFFEMGGGIDADFEVGYVEAGIRGWITANAFNVDGDAEVGVKLDGRRVALIGAHATLSTRGIAACGEVPVINLGGGLGARWGESIEAFWGCDLDPYREARPADAPAIPNDGDAASAAMASASSATVFGKVDAPLFRDVTARVAASRRGHELVIPKGTGKALLTVEGRSGAPRLRIVDARGRSVLATPGDGRDTLTPRMMVRHDAKHRRTQVLWKRPPAGRLYVLRQQGSSEVRSVAVALPSKPRKITAAVTGRGAARTLRWSVTPKLERGQKLLLAEEGVGAGQELILTARSRGTLRFTPQGGAAGRRTIQGTLVTSGLPAEPKVVGRYTAPPPAAPDRPQELRIERGEGQVVAHWRSLTGLRPADWQLEARVNGSRRQVHVAAGKRRRIIIPDVTAGDTVRVTLAGRTASGTAGRAATATLAPGMRWSDGRGAKLGTAQPRAVRVKRLANGQTRITWRTGGAFVERFAVRVTAGGKTLDLAAPAHVRALRVDGLPEGEPVTVSIRASRYGAQGMSPAATGKLAAE